MQQKCFMGIFHFIMQNIKKMYTDGGDLIKLIAFIAFIRGIFKWNRIFYIFFIEV